jgi:uncharacterized membrane protein
MYRIIGGDQKEYGPVTAEEIRQWIIQGRANAQTVAQAEGSAGWKSLRDFPEFADVLAAGAAPIPPPAAGAGAGLSTLPGDVLERDYVLRIGSCFSRGWELLKSDFGLVFGATLAFLGIQFAIGMLGAIPILGPLISLASIVVYGPLNGGLYYFYLKKIRNQPAEVGDIFAGFRRSFAQLMLAQIVITALACLAMIPGGILVAISVVPMIIHGAPSPGLIILALAGAVLAVAPAAYLGVSWLYAVPLVIDKQLEFWPAMETSRKVVAKHWWHVFGLMLVAGLLNLAGLLVCCVGMWITFPIALGAITYAYEDLFGTRPTPAA